MSEIKAVFFDYGETLIHELYFDPKKGTKAVLKYSNKPDYDVEKIQQLASRFSKEQRRYQKKEEEGNYIEIQNDQFQHFLLDYFNIEVDESNISIEEVFWNEAAPYEIVDGSIELLEFLVEKEFKIGVISNIAFNSKLLEKRLKKAFPLIHFDVVVSSADYGIRKPNSLIFDIACKKANVEQRNVIYIGDQREADLLGALNCGMKGIQVNKQYANGMNQFEDLKQVKEYLQNEL